MTENSDYECAKKNLPMAYALAEANPEAVLDIALNWPDLREELKSICNRDGWSAYHRLADIKPAFFARMIDSLDATDAAGILSVCKKEGCCAVAGIFAKHCAKHGDGIGRLVARLHDGAAAALLQLMDCVKTPLSYALIDSHAESVVHMALARPTLLRVMMQISTSDGWSPFHRLADVEPAHFSRLVDSVDAAAAVAILCTNKRGGGCSVADMFAKHAARHGDAFVRLMRRLSDELALRIVGQGILAYVLVDGQPGMVVSLCLTRPALRAALVHQDTFNGDGWSTYHRLADLQPALFAELLDGLNGAAALDLLAIRKSGGGCSVAGLFVKHAQEHGDVLLRLVGRLGDTEVSEVLGLTDGRGTPLAYALVDSHAAQLVGLALERPALRLAMQSACNADGWSTLHRLADKQPALVTELLDRLDAATGADILALCQRGGGCSVGGLFVLHAVQHGDAVLRLLRLLRDTEASDLLGLTDGRGTPLAYALVDSHAAQLVGLALERPALRSAMQSACNADGWSTFHRLADKQPAHFAQLLSSVDDVVGAGMLSFSRRGGEASVEDVFRKNNRGHQAAAGSAAGTLCTARVWIGCALLLALAVSLFMCWALGLLPCSNLRSVHDASAMEVSHACSDSIF